MNDILAAPVESPRKPKARVYGQPLEDLPADLYIPPEALEVVLEAFEGPLDLLLYLIRKHNLDILDIPMAELTRQYMEYVERIRRQQLELAAEYLVMAAMLTEIKSRMLLPRPPREVETPEADPRAELVRRLLEYERMRQAALALDALPQAGRDFRLVRVYLAKVAEARLPDVDVEQLAAAWEAIVARARRNRHHRITREELSVREHMSRVLRVLQAEGRKEFGELFPVGGSVPELVVTFLAILELAKQCMLEISQAYPYAPLYVQLMEAAADEREPR